MRAFFSWFFALTVSAAGFIGCSHTAKHAPPKIVGSIAPAEVLQRQTVALVETDSTEKMPVPVCSGIWVDQTHILTAAHCVEKELPADLQKLFPDDVKIKVNPMSQPVDYEVFDDMNQGELEDLSKKRTALVVGYAPQYDLALLAAPVPPKHTVVNLGAPNLQVGTTTRVVGHTMTMGWSYMEGPISMTRFTQAGDSFPTKVHLVQISVPAWSGDSGGGAFDSQGNLIGVALFVFKKAPNLTFFIGREEINSFLVSNGVKVP